MKIAFLRYPKELYETGRVARGGSEIANQIIIDQLRQKGVEIVEFCPDSAERLDLIDLPALGTPLMFQDLLRKIDQINKCDLVITTNWLGAILPEIKKPLVTIFHSDALMVREQIELARIRDRKQLQKWLKRLRSSGFAQKTMQNEHEKIISLGERYFINRSTKIIAVSAFLKKSLERHYPLNDRRVAVIPNPYPADWVEYYRWKEFLPRQLGLISISRLPAGEDNFIGKGIDRLFEVFDRTGQYPRTLLGSTTQTGLTGLLKKTFAGINFIANANRSEVARHLSQTHLSLHCSRAEAFGLTILEAMLMGSVPIAFPTGAAKDLIKERQNGFLVKNTKEMIRIIHHLENYPKEAARMAQSARESVMMKFSPESVGQQYFELLYSLAKKR